MSMSASPQRGQAGRVPTLDMTNLGESDSGLIVIPYTFASRCYNYVQSLRFRYETEACPPALLPLLYLIQTLTDHLVRVRPVGVEKARPHPDRAPTSRVRG